MAVGKSYDTQKYDREIKRVHGPLFLPAKLLPAAFFKFTPQNSGRQKSGRQNSWIIETCLHVILTKRYSLKPTTLTYQINVQTFTSPNYAKPDKRAQYNKRSHFQKASKYLYQRFQTFINHI